MYERRGVVYRTHVQPSLVLEQATSRNSASLRWIQAHRTELRKRALEGCAASAIALARLFEIQTVDEEVLSVLRALPPKTHPRLPLLVAMGLSELGRLEAAEAYLRGLPNPVLEAETRLVLLLLAMKRGETPEVLRADLGILDDAWDAPTKAVYHCAEFSLLLCEGRKLDARNAIALSLEQCLRFDGPEAAVAYGFLGNAEMDLGNWTAASQAFRHSIRLSQSLDNHSAAAVFLGYLGWTSWFQNREALARRQLLRSIEQTRSLGLVRFQAMFEALRACMGLGPRNVEARECAFAEALARLGQSGDVQRRTALSPLWAMFSVARAHRETRAQGGHGAAHLVAAYRHLQTGSAMVDDGRLAKTMVRRALDHALPEPGSEVGLWVSPGATEVWLSGEVVSFRDNPALARLLWALVEGAVDERPRSDEELRETGWPQERSRLSSKTHRLRVAISTLRKHIRIQRIGEGYRLVGEVAVGSVNGIESD